jgi:hypothetical protein
VAAKRGVVLVIVFIVVAVAISAAGLLFAGIGSGSRTARRR